MPNNSMEERAEMARSGKVRVRLIGKPEHIEEVKKDLETFYDVEWTGTYPDYTKGWAKGQTKPKDTIRVYGWLSRESLT